MITPSSQYIEISSTFFLTKIMKTKFLFFFLLLFSNLVFADNFPMKKELFSCRFLNPVLGGGFKPNCTTQWKKMVDEYILFNINFSTDEYGRRITPGGYDKKYTNNVLFFGCSFILGTGVEPNQTLPYYFIDYFQNTNVFNYAGSGFGPQQMLAALSEMDLKSQVPKVKDRHIAVYTFLDFHIARALGKPSVFNTFAKYFPNYEVDENNVLVRKGNFLTGRPLRSRIYELINDVPILNNIFERIIENVSENDLNMTIRIIVESKNKFKSVFKSQDFFVLFYPASDKEVTERLKPYLEHEGIKYFDYTGLVDMQRLDARVKDGHPAPWVHQIIAKKFAEDLTNYLYSN